MVEGVKISRGKESPLHTLAAKTFYRFLSGATRIDMSHASDFKLLDRRAVDVLVAVYMIRQVIGRNRLGEGISRIAAGEVDYKIPLEACGAARGMWQKRSTP